MLSYVSDLKVFLVSFCGKHCADGWVVIASLNEEYGEVVAEWLESWSRHSKVMGSSLRSCRE